MEDLPNIMVMHYLNISGQVAGGGGYYGGSAGENQFGGGNAGGGGSGFVSSILTKTVITSGNLSMPSPSSSTQTGQSGDGYAKITLLTEKVENSMIYENYGIGVYKDRECQSLITQKSNHIKLPVAPSGFTFGGYYTSKNGKGTKLIDEEGYLTANFINTYFTADSTIYAYWIVERVYTFKYTGTIQYIDLDPGKYKLEVWGAQGGSSIYHYGRAYSTFSGGKGGYSSGIYNISSKTRLYVVVGQSGYLTNGSYNGGGSGLSTSTKRRSKYYYTGSGGGATHISTKSGLLYNLSSDKSSILLVAGGGRWSWYSTKKLYKII